MFSAPLGVASSATDYIPPPDYSNGHVAPDGAVSFFGLAFYKDVAPDRMALGVETKISQDAKGRSPFA
jgi:hypothetical protein